MYKVTNISLKPYLDPKKVETVYDLDHEGLTELCEQLRVDPVVIRDEKKRPTGIDRYNTARILEATYSVSEYISQKYWEQKHYDIAEDVKLLDDMEHDKHGYQTFERYARLGFGIYNLRPGETANVNWTRRWLADILVHKPAFTMLMIEDPERGQLFTREKIGEDKHNNFIWKLTTMDLDGKKKKKDAVEKKVIEATETQDIIREAGFDSYKELQAEAKKRGINPVQKTEDLVEALGFTLKGRQ